jgi:hypothetical protein
MQGPSSESDTRGRVVACLGDGLRAVRRPLNEQAIVLQNALHGWPRVRIIVHH